MPIKRSGIFYFRRAIPTDLVNHLQCHEIKVSLRTRDRSIALQRELLCDIKFQQIIEDARQGMEFPKGFMSRFETITKTHTKKDGSKVTETTKTVGPEIIKAFQDAGLSPDEIAGLTRIFIESTSENASAVDSANTSDTSLHNTTLGDYVKRYQKDYEIINKVCMDTRVVTRLRRLIEIIDPEQPLASFTLEQAGHVRDMISDLPSKNRKYENLTVSQAIAAAKKDDAAYNRLTAKTINDYMESYRALFKKAIADKLYPDHTNPFQHIRVAVRGSEARAEAKRRADARHQRFSADDLHKIFTTDLHLEFGSSSLDENFKYWLPLLGLLTGSRMSQLASLYCDDIRSEDGINVIDFNENSSDKVVKTGASIRLVPIHPLLERLGLIDFSLKVREAGHERLFPELSSFSRGSYAKRFEEWFNRRLLVDVEVRNEKLERGKSFHSFRATLLDLLKQAGIEESQRNQIIGWSRNSEESNNLVREHYDSANLELMKAALEKLVLPDIFNKLPPFPCSTDLKFERPIINQHTNKIN
jgi:hypothetical protein